MQEQSRPKITIPIKNSDLIIEVISVVLLVVFWIYTILQYNSLPDIIPTHFKGDGSVDGTGPRWMIFGLPIVSTLFYIGLAYASRFPEKFNYMTEITKQNAPKQYTIAAQMLRVMKLCIIVVFFAVDYQTVLSAHGNESELGGWFMIFIMSLIFVPLFYFLIQFSKNS
jgi:uncharacterized membrane protein